MTPATEEVIRKTPPSGLELKCGTAARQRAICALTFTCQHYTRSVDEEVCRLEQGTWTHAVPFLISVPVQISESALLGISLRMLLSPGSRQKQTTYSIADDDVNAPERFDRLFNELFACLEVAGILLFVTS